MKKQNEIGLDFEVDKLTNSIENVITGDSFTTEVSLLLKDELKFITKSKGWLFNWVEEFKHPEREVFKLTIVGNHHVIQGLICFEIKEDHIFMHLLENAPFNRGKEKVYAGVAGNLVAFACKVSFQRGFEGNLSFLSKTQLIEYYEKTLGAFHFGGHVMIVETKSALKLIGKYFK